MFDAPSILKLRKSNIRAAYTAARGTKKSLSDGEARFVCFLREGMDDASLRLGQGYVKYAFDLSLYILSTEISYNRDEYYESENEFVSSEKIIEFIKEVCAAADKEIGYCVKRLCAESDTARMRESDCSVSLLEIAAEYAAADNSAHVMDALDRAERGLRVDYNAYNYSYNEKKRGLLASAMISLKRRLFGDTAAEEYISRRTDINSVLVMQYEQTLAAKNYEAAIKLCIKPAKREASSFYMKDLSWNNRLAKTYEAAGDITSARGVFEPLIADGNVYALNSYRKLYTDDAWRAALPSLIRTKLRNLDADTAAEYLAGAGLYELLAEKINGNDYLLIKYCAKIDSDIAAERLMSSMKDRAAKAKISYNYDILKKLAAAARGIIPAERLDCLLKMLRTVYAKDKLLLAAIE